MKDASKLRSNDRRLRSTHRQALGKWGEDLAVDYLRQRGYVILECNARTPYGEIDVVAREDSVPANLVKDAPTVDPKFVNETLQQHLVTVFVEVKTRSSEAFGLPEEAITPRKKTHLLAAAQAYLQTHPELDGDWRVDVIAIQRLSSHQPPTIVHFENAVT